MPTDNENHCWRCFLFQHFEETSKSNAEEKETLQKEIYQLKETLRKLETEKSTLIVKLTETESVVSIRTQCSYYNYLVVFRSPSLWPLYHLFLLSIICIILTHILSCSSCIFVLHIQYLSYPQILVFHRYVPLMWFHIVLIVHSKHILHFIVISVLRRSSNFICCARISFISFNFTKFLMTFNFDVFKKKKLWVKMNKY